MIALPPSACLLKNLSITFFSMSLPGCLQSLNFLPDLIRFAQFFVWIHPFIRTVLTKALTSDSARPNCVLKCCWTILWTPHYFCAWSSQSFGKISQFTSVWRPAWVLRITSPSKCFKIKEVWTDFLYFWKKVASLMAPKFSLM